MFLFFFSLLYFLSPTPVSALTREGVYLQRVKLTLSDPYSSLSSWNEEDDTPCNWFGVTCDSVTHSVNSVDLTNANVAGPFPSLLCRIRHLAFLSLRDNFISSTLCDYDISKCGNLKHLDLSENSLTGLLPHTLPELRDLEYLDLGGNSFSGSIPASFGRFRRLEVMSLVSNFLNGRIPGFLGNITTLKILDLSYNPFNPGRVPPELGNLTKLEILRVTDCNLVGEIPNSLCRLKRLIHLDLATNYLVGTIPSSLTELTSVVEIELRNNSLTGKLPSGLRLFDASMKRLSGEISDGLCRLHSENLNLDDYKFEGQIPETLATSPNLYELRLSHNRFAGELPENLGGNSPLRWIDLSSNAFTGKLPVRLFERGLTFPTLPDSIVNLSELSALDLHGNCLSGELPLEIEYGKNLNELNLADNAFYGNIPDEIGTLPVLSYLDLPRNRFSGEITNGPQNLESNQFNMSNNQLSGKLPVIFAKEMYRKSFMGNSSLGAALKVFSASRNEETEQGYAWLLLLPLILVLAVSVFAAGLAWFYFKYRNFKKPVAIDKSKWTSMSFHKLGFSEYEILDCLDESIVIGGGASGKVYKAVLSNGKAVAVKKLWGGAKKNLEMVDTEKSRAQDADNVFETQIETLGKIRHKNIAKLQCCCATRDCKLLAYEHLPNGSLGDMLHRNKRGVLDWPTRYKIIVGAAEGLSYLHHDCFPPIVHGNFKSNNILLDGDFGARVAHFGFAKLVKDNGKESKSMSGFSHSCGYMAPEYVNKSKASQKSDIYCFGVVMLELVTGKLSINSEFRAKDLVTWVRSMRDQKCLDKVFDPKLDLCFKEEIIKVLKIGLLCTDVLPINRPSMRILVKAFKK